MVSWFVPIHFEPSIFRSERGDKLVLSILHMDADLQKESQVDQVHVPTLGNHYCIETALLLLLSLLHVAIW